MFRMHFILLSLLPLVCGVFLFSGKTEKRIRACLLSSLKRSYLKEQPLIKEVPAVRTNPESKAFIFDIQQKLSSEFLDFRAFSSLSQINSIFHDSLKRAVNQRLVAFHPHFASEDSLVNTLLYCVLNEHFRFIKSANDPLVHDHLQLLCAKYFHDDLDFNAIPSNIYYYIICFMFEMIYETDLKTPETKREFLNQLVCSFRSSNYSLELSYKYVLANYFIEDHSNCSDDFKFFYAEPSIRDIKTRFQVQILDQIRIAIDLQQDNLLTFRTFAVLEALLPDFDQQQHILIIFKFFYRNFHYSSKLVGIIRSHEYSELRPQIANFWAKGKYHSIAFEAAEITNDVIDSNSELVAKINPMKLLKLDDFKNMSIRDQINWLKFISSNQMYSLSKIDACSKLVTSIRSHVQNSSDVLNSLNSFNSLLLELFIKEAKIPLSEEALQRLFVVSKANASFLRLFLGLMRSDDPFIFLFFPLSILKKAKCLIQDKFDLNAHYLVKDRTMIHLILRRCMNYATFPISTFDFMSDDVGARMRCNCSFSFKEAVNSFGNDELKSIFSSNLQEFDDCSLVFYNQPTKRLSSAFENVEIDAFYLYSYMDSFVRLKAFVVLLEFKDKMMLISVLLTYLVLFNIIFDEFGVVCFIVFLSARLFFFYSLLT